MPNAPQRYPQQHRDITIISFNGKTPRIHDSAFIAPGCRIIGDVTIGPESSVWYNCVLRADVASIHIGAQSNIQDGTVIHCDGPLVKNEVENGVENGTDFPTIIGDNVLVGHMVMLHGCILEDRAFVGLGAVVMNGCRLGGDAMLAAGALLTEHKTIPPRELWAGRPARKLRMIDDATAAAMQDGVRHYVENGRHHRAAVAEGP